MKKISIILLILINVTCKNNTNSFEEFLLEFTPMLGTHFSTKRDGERWMKEKKVIEFRKYRHLFKEINNDDLDTLNYVTPLDHFKHIIEKKYGLLLLKNKMNYFVAVFNKTSNTFTDFVKLNKKLISIRYRMNSEIGRRAEINLEKIEYQKWDKDFKYRTKHIKKLIFIINSKGKIELLEKEINYEKSFMFLNEEYEYSGDYSLKKEKIDYTLKVRDGSNKKERYMILEAINEEDENIMSFIFKKFTLKKNIAEDSVFKILFLENSVLVNFNKDANIFKDEVLFSPIINNSLEKKQ